MLLIFLILAFININASLPFTIKSFSTSNLTSTKKTLEGLSILEIKNSIDSLKDKKTSYSNEYDFLFNCFGETFFEDTDDFVKQFENLSKESFEEDSFDEAFQSMSNVSLNLSKLIQ